MKETSKNQISKEFNVLVIVIAATLLIAAIAILFFTNYKIQTNSQGIEVLKKGTLTDNETSANNISLMQEAIRLRDAKICDQISGAINYTNPNEEKSQGGLSKGVSIVTPAMTESEAKEECLNHVQDLIDRDTYKSEVCQDKNLTHFEFNGVRFPCPEE